MEIKQVRRKKTNTCEPARAKEMLDKLRKEHSKLVKGKFEFVDAGGGFIEFNYRYFPEDMLVSYKFVHNEVCEVPMGLIKHINNTKKKIRIFSDELTDRGVPSTYTTNSRIRFTPVDMF